MHKHARRLLALAALSLAAATAAAQSWPTQPIRWIVPYAPGGSADVVTRLLAQKLNQSLGQPFVVENKPGANTVLAAEAVAAAKPDGYTLLAAATNHTMIPALYAGRVRFDAARSFRPVCTLASSATVLVACACPGGVPKNISTGNVSNVPPPATALITPAAAAWARSTMPPRMASS